MSFKDSNLVIALRDILGIDLKQTITCVKKTILNEQTFSLEVYIKHSSSLKALQELIAAASRSSNSTEKEKGEQLAIEGFITDVCLPFLYFFTPSFDGRAELSASVLKVCDLIFVCLKQSSQEIVRNVMEICWQSLTHYQQECTRSSESSSEQILDIVCALELLCSTLKISDLVESNQNVDLYDKIFSASVAIIHQLDEKSANRVISFVIIKLAQMQHHRKDAYLLEVWKSVESDVLRFGKSLSAYCLNQHLVIMTSMANLFFPLDDIVLDLDVRKQQTFWELLQMGLYSNNPAVRKRSMYLLKRIIDTCEKTGQDLQPGKDGEADLHPTVLPYFWWSKQKQQELSKMWEDFLLLLESFDEKQTHVIKPILPRMQIVVSATKRKNSCSLLHTSWIVTLLMRAFHHESVFIIRWAVERVLFMDFASVPFVEQTQLEFLTQQLLSSLRDLALYQRPDGSPVGSCTSVGTGLKHFFASVCQSMDNKQQKVEFLKHVLLSLVKENWSSVPLVFITQGLSFVPPTPVLDCCLLAHFRDMVTGSLTTLESFPRGAIECFITKTVLNLIDKENARPDALAETLAVLNQMESLKRGTKLWSTVMDWLLTSSDDLDPVWGWLAMVKSLKTEVDQYLAVTVNTSGNVLSENMTMTKIARLLTLLADARNKKDALQHEEQSLLSSTYAGCVDIINSVNSRAYMPRLKADRALGLLYASSREMGQMRDACSVQLSLTIQACWDQLLLYVATTALAQPQGDAAHDSMDLDLVIFYADVVKTLGRLLPTLTGVGALHRLADSCWQILHLSSSASPLQRVAASCFLSATAQLLRPNDVKSNVEHKLLSDSLCSKFAVMSLDCDIFTKIKENSGSSFDYGRHVSQYMTSLWECLLMLLKWKPTQRDVMPIIGAAFEAFSISAGDCDLPIIQCLEIILPRAAENVGQHAQLQELLEISWSKVTEEIKSWSYWLKMEAFVSLVLQTPLLQLDPQSPLGLYTSQVLDRFFQVGVDKSGLLNLVMARLTKLWSSRDGGATLAAKMAPTIVDACMFGTVHKKTERVWLDVCMYIETLKDECSVNEILSSSSKSDIYVRLITINYLSTLSLHVEEERLVALAVLKEAWGRYLSLAQMSTHRQYSNTLPHRQKHRLAALFPFLDCFIDESSSLEVYGKCWEALTVECHPSVRQNLEWLLMRLVQRYPQHLLPHLWIYFNEFTDKRNVSLMSLLHIVTRLGPELPTELQESYYLHAMPLVMPWTMANHFNTRLHGQVAMSQLWLQTQRLDIGTNNLSLIHNCILFLQDNGNATAILNKLLDNYFYGPFHFLHDYSMETLFFTLPKLACLNDEEWMHPDLFLRLDCKWESNHTRLMPLYNTSKTLAVCEPGPWKMKAPETNEETCESTEGNVQKKIIPWKLMTPDSHAEQEYSYRKKGGKPDGLILVTSLINKIPNLGGLCRTSEIFGVSEFVIGNLSYLNDRTFQSLSVTAEKWIPVTEVQEFRLSEFLEEKKRESYTLVGVEQTANSIDLTQYSFPKKTLLVLGSEKEGIPPIILQQLDVCVEIPQQGIIRSLNVHVSGALLIWEYTRQQLEQSHIEQS